MPRAINYNKEKILEAAIEIVREYGVQNLTTRKIAEKLNTSTQPIYSQFKNTSDLLESVIERIYVIMIDDYLTSEAADSFLGMGLGLIRFAKLEKNLFYSLYMFDGIDNEFRKNLYENNKERFTKLMSKGENMGDYDEETLIRIHKKITLFTHGIACRVVFDSDFLTDDEIETILTETAHAIVEFESRRG